MTEEFPCRDIDTVFADFVSGRAGGSPELLRRAALLASAAVGSGNICLDLAEAFGAAETEKITDSLLATGIVGEPGEYAPLVLDKTGRLYLYRYWKYESDLAAALIAMAGTLPEIDAAMLRDGLDRLFGEAGAETDWQRTAAAAAVRSRFCVISGGPGTGKTTTVVRILALLLEQAKGGRMRIGLAAPTGKAAARLKESIRMADADLQGRTPVASLIPGDVSTLQRLLGAIPGAGRFRYDAGNPLPFEAVVVDEASMVPLGMMSRLTAALAPGARLILLGDRDQLASVEAGAVLGDICNTGNFCGFSRQFQAFAADVAGCRLTDELTGPENLPLADSIMVLEKNYRFGDGSAIGLVSRAINNGDGENALKLMKSGGAGEVTVCETPGRESLKGRLAKAVREGYGGYLQSGKPDDALAAFDSFRVLCATRQGLHGIENINEMIESCLGELGIIRPDRQWYHGRPVMVTVNNYSLKLFNGDIGIVLNDPESEIGLSVFFRAVNGGVRKFSPYRLPPHETVFAMTVHKSQGSEFDRLLLIMPNIQSQVLSREILYTGITRARSAVDLWCSDEIFRTSVGRRILRRSGLRRALWGEGLPV